MRIKMDKIDSINKLKNPKFIKPIEITYTHKSIQRKWEAVISHDSVAILLWHKDKDSFVFVKQLRATVLNKNPKNGYMYELCAGIIDKNKSDEEIAAEEVFEECGYNIKPSQLQKISSFYTSVGISGTHQTLYYAQIDDSMKVSEGGGLSEEDIEVIYIPTKDANSFMFDESYQKTTGVMLAIYWFFQHISDTKQTL
jgi:UDP-sugar diphosphatase